MEQDYSGFSLGNNCLSPAWVSLRWLTIFWFFPDINLQIKKIIFNVLFVNLCQGKICPLKIVRHLKLTHLGSDIRLFEESRIFNQPKLALRALCGEPPRLGAPPRGHAGVTVHGSFRGRGEAAKRFFDCEMLPFWLEIKYV